MINPRSDMSPRMERPRLTIAFCKRPLAPLVRIFSKSFQRQFEERFRASGMLLQSTTACTNRHQLEQLLGQPRYVMFGTRYGMSSSPDAPMVRPDVVNVYERDRYMIEVWFKNGALMTIVAMAFQTDWEILSGVMDVSLP